MLVPKKMIALVAGSLVALSAIAVAGPQEPAPAGGSSVPTLLLNDVTLDWIEKSDVAALREGVIEKMEARIGNAVLKDRPIGYLNAELAKLSVSKAKLAAEAKAPMAKAKASYDLAVSVVATSKRLNVRSPGTVSQEQMRKEEAEVTVAEAMMLEAEERVAIDQAELALAARMLEEHTIRAPFDGIVIEENKYPGESVRANESVVKIGKLDRLRAFAYVPLDAAYKVKEGQLVDLQPVLAGTSENPFGNKTFRGKITFVDPRIQPINETAVRIYAEFENPGGELRPGLKGRMVVYLTNEPAAASNLPSLTRGAATNAAR